MNSLLIFAAAFSCAMAASTTVMMPTTTKHHGTHHPHVTHEPSETASVHFAYDFHTHQMVVFTHHNCYIFTLSADEQVAVHTDAGMAALELKLLGLVSTATTTVVTKDSVDAHLVRACGAHTTTYYTVSQ